ncbi:unnamed protein product [Euphydryas editha]|uniref:Uncharacterized protein n=1 Tax=Euphydryas editha TaxID=104508 RepID=A0AAU9U2G4_EUPED|nr:unnamed protein product [Euphydryas editha]
MDVLQDLCRTEKQRAKDKNNKKESARKRCFRIQDGRTLAKAFPCEVMPNGGSAGETEAKEVLVGQRKETPAYPRCRTEKRDINYSKYK